MIRPGAGGAGWCRGAANPGNRHAVRCIGTCSAVGYHAQFSHAYAPTMKHSSHSPAILLRLLVLLSAFALAGRASAQVLLVGDNAMGVIGTYDAATGAALNANLVSVSDPYSLAVLGDSLYVSQFGEDTVGKYSVSTGAAVNPAFIVVDSTWPNGMLFAGGNLLVANYAAGDVRSYDPTTGAPVGTLIAGLSGPRGLALAGNSLYVSNWDSGTVGKYDATTGAIDSGFSLDLNGDNPFGLAVAGGSLLVVDYSAGSVRQYDAGTGELQNDSFIVDLSSPFELAVSGNDLFVSNYGAGAVGKYNATTGEVIDAGFISGLSGPIGLAVMVTPVPEPATYALIAGVLALGGVLIRRRRRKTN